MGDLEHSAEELFAEALDVEPGRRAAFLDGACRGAPELRRLVEQLLQQNQRAGSFLAQPLLTPETVATVPSSRFQPGEVIADRFRVVRFIARGGMGEVYEVKDQFLRDAGIALKIIRPEMAADAATATRFEQEVILARKVVHTHLCPIYDIFRCEEPAPPFLFLTMKMLQGQTLEARLQSGKLETEEAMEICSQLLTGVGALHSAGIIHRDLKPNNVMLEATGQHLNVSIMDFGLARLHQAEATILGTGMIAGTPGYMAPELLRGERPTRATDLFALGIVLHQVLTGERPIESERGLSFKPAPSLRSVHAPVEWVQAVEDFLSSDPEHRSAGFERIQPAVGNARNAANSSRSSSHRRPAVWYWAAAALIAASIVIAAFLTPAPLSGALDSTQITFSALPKEGPLLTDGVRFYFESRGMPSQMSISGGIIAPIPNLEPGTRLMNISPDGAKVLEWRPEPNDDIRRGSLWMASSLGGTARRLGNYLVNTPDWGAAAFSPDGQSIAFADKRVLYVADAEGANVKKLWQAPGYVDGVCFSPGGRELTVSVWTRESPSRLWRLKADGTGSYPLLADWPAQSEQAGAEWTADGRHFMFTSDREGRLNVYELVKPRWFEFWKKPAAVRITGNQIPILASVPAHDSTHLFVLGKADQGEMRALNPKTGKLEPYPSGLSASEFVISPDRQWMAYSDFPTGHLWKSKLDGTQAVELSKQEGGMARWSPDGKWLVFSDALKLYLVSADGGPTEKVIAKGEREVAPSWSPDGKSIVFNYYNFTDQPSGGISMVDLATRKVSLMPNTRGFQGASWSPDGRYMLVTAQQPSRMMLYTAKSRTWTELTEFKDPPGFWAWANDSKSIYMAMVQGHDGIYRLTVPNGKWDKVGALADTYRGLSTFYASVSVTPEGQPAMMAFTGVAQIYSLAWKH